MITPLLVALGGAMGAALRFTLGKLLDGTFHVGTLTANTLACLVIGLAGGAALSGAAWALVATGFCGGLSTYSSFAVQARDRGARIGSAYVVLTLALGLGAAALGFRVAA
ncbi:CrcB family protein [Nocardioides panacisoli]|uniref:Fluoride-specific ion channel FluC n=1 Tax=Nocardioides panacisoli TaxID=627624 RepID=A0ABP7IV46_9ACTN